ncbi:hypothetical protein [Hydrogenivirga sp.]
MRVKFRISLYRGDRRLRRSDLRDIKDPLWVGIRYITEFKYLEATKWLLIAPDCYEKYLLLGLVNLSLGQEEQAQEFLSCTEGRERLTDLRIFLEKPEEKVRIEASDVGRVVKLPLR